MKRFFTTYIVATALILTGCKEHCEVDNISVFELSQSEFQIANSGETVSVKVVSKINWTAKTTEDWIRLKAEDIESVDGRDADKDFASTIAAPFNTNRAGGYVKVEIEITENPTSTSRNGEITFTTSDMQTFTVSVTQTAGEPDDDDFSEDMELMFPDPIFRAYVMENFDTDKDGKISKEEAEKVTMIIVEKSSSTPDNEKIASLEGVQYFTNLTYLSCYYNKLTELDVSRNTALTSLYCYNNQLTELDVTQNTNLKQLDCWSNQLTELDVTQNPALTGLYCNYNQLTELDVTQNTELRYLNCDSNQLTTLDVTHNPELIYLMCHSNQLTELDVTHNTALTNLTCSSNQLTELDVTQNTAMTQLYCYFNQLTELDVTHNPELIYLMCHSNQLTTLDVTQNTALIWLECYSSQLTELGVTQNTALRQLYCHSNQLTELDVTQNTLLTILVCYSNQLTELDVTHNPELIWLECYSNQLTTLDVSKTNLGNSNRYNPLDCSPMNGDGLETLYLKEGWTINGISPDRNNSYVPANTNILFKD